MFLLFILVSLISFIGSLHPGTVSLAVVQTTLSQGRRAGLWLALGGSLPELFWSSVAAGGLMLLPMQLAWTSWLAYAPIPVLLGMGIVAFRQKAVVFTTPLVTNGQAAGGGALFPFWKGVVLGGSNPQLLPFWSAVWLYLSGSVLVPVGQSGSLWVFAMGTAAGAFGLLGLVAWLANRKRQQILRYLSGHWLNRLTGVLFLGMALWQLIRVI
ncbi:MAG: LysE family transporter [Spirosoma sp.]|nr:LysE family transporter [Spirosoma sp.]